MKKIYISMAVFVMLLLSACRADPDVILLDGAESDYASVREAEQTEQPSGENAAEPVIVYICGAVCEPGVYEMDPGDRIYQLIDRAGGFTDDACTDRVNLADGLTDGQMLRILTKEEAADPANAAAEYSNPEGAEVIDLNRAGTDELTALNGIGESKAAAIVEYRQEHGAFHSTEELMQVEGIGSATYEKIKDRVSVR